MKLCFPFSSENKTFAWSRYEQSPREANIPFLVQQFLKLISLSSSTKKSTTHRRNLNEPEKATVLHVKTKSGTDRGRFKETTFGMQGCSQPVGPSAGEGTFEDVNLKISWGQGQGGPRTLLDWLYGPTTLSQLGYAPGMWKQRRIAKTERVLNCPN